MIVEFYQKNIPDFEGKDRLVECFKFEIPEVCKIDEIASEANRKEYPKEYEAFRESLKVKKSGVKKKLKKVVDEVLKGTKDLPKEPVQKDLSKKIVVKKKSKPKEEEE